jgi:hypothetical protein
MIGVIIFKQAWKGLAMKSSTWAILVLVAGLAALFACAQHGEPQYPNDPSGPGGGGGRGGGDDDDDNDNDTSDDDNDTSDDDTVAGACCDLFNYCWSTTASDCTLGYNGIYHSGETCSASPCQTPTGACCKPNHTCVDNVTQAYCTGLSGTWRGDQYCGNTAC